MSFILTQIQVKFQCITRVFKKKQQQAIKRYAQNKKSNIKKNGEIELHTK